MFLITAATHARIQIGKLVDTALRQCGMSHKEAAILAGVSLSEWSRAIHALARFDASWLLALPWRFHAVYAPLYLNAVVEALIVDIQPQMVKADLRNAEDERKRA